MDEDDPEILDDKNLEINELSLIIGNVLKDPEVMSDVLKTVNEVDQYGKSVSLSLLLGSDEKITNFEKRKFKTSDFNYSKLSLFREKINNYFNENHKDFPVLSNKTSATSLEKSNSSIEDYILEND